MNFDVHLGDVKRAVSHLDQVMLKRIYEPVCGTIWRLIIGMFKKDAWIVITIDMYAWISFFCSLSNTIHVETTMNTKRLLTKSAAKGSFTNYLCGNTIDYLDSPLD